MKKIILIFFLSLSFTITVSAQSLEAICRTIYTSPYQRYDTKCYVYFNVPQKSIKVTYPQSMSFYIKGVESLSSGSLHLLAKGSDGCLYTLYFKDFSALVGGSLMQLNYVKKSSTKNEKYTNYYHLNSNVVIPILNKFLKGLD